MYKLMMLLLVLSQITGCAVMGVFSIPSIEGAIVDVETGEPIEGAVVVVRRGLKGGYEGGTVGYYKYQETITNGEGKYVIPSEGIVYAGRTFSENAPELIIFKAGYSAKFLSNYCPEWYDYKGYPKGCKDRDTPLGTLEVSWYQDSVWTDEKIVLEKFNGMRDEWIHHLYHIKSLAININRTGECSWVGFEIPKLLGAIDSELKLLGEMGLNITRENVKKKSGEDGWVVGDKDRDCPEQWEKFFREYNP